MLKFNNSDRTSACFNATSFSLASPEDWDSIGDTPTREAVQAWLSEGNTPEPADVPSLDSLKAEALVEVRTLRTAFFSVLAGLQSEALARGDTTLALAIAAIQQGGRQITQTDLSACTTKVQIDAAFLAAWMALVATAPASIITAFRSVTS